MRNWFTYLVVFIICFAPTADAQQTNYRFINFSYLDGLPDKSIYDFTQDDQGFLWVGGISGLYRYDGHKFKHFKSDKDDDQNQISNSLTNILYDHDQKVIWLSSISDLQYLDLKTYIFHRLPKSDLFDLNAGMMVNFLFKKDKENLWLGTLNGLFEYNLSSNKWREVVKIWPTEKSITTKNLKSIAKIGPNKAALVHQKNVIIYDWVHDKITSAALNIKDNIHHVVYDSVRNNLWFSCISSLVKSDLALQTIKLFTIKQTNSELDAKLHSMVLLDNDRLSISGNIQFDLRSETYDVIKNGDGIFDNQLLYVSNQFVDRQGNLWLGSFESVCSMMPFQNQSVQSFPVLSAKKEGIEVLSVLKPIGKYAIYLTGPPLVGVKKIELSSGKEMILSEGWPENQYSYYLTQLESGKIIACSHHQLYELDEISGKFREIKLVSKTAVFEIGRIHSLMSYRENKLVLSTSSEIIIIDIESGQSTIHLLKNIPDLKTRYFNPIYVGKQGTIYFACISGLYKLDDETEEIEKIIFPESNTGRKVKHVESAIQDSKGNLWITTSLNGVFKFNSTTNQLSNINKENSKLTSDFLQSITLDSNENVIVGSPSEIYKIHPETMNCFGVYKKQNGFTRDDQAYGISVQGNFMIKNNFASVDLLDLSKYKTNNFVGKPILTSFEVMGIEKLQKPIYSDTTFYLKYDENFVSISFASLNLSNSNQETYKYRLIGLDTSWIYLTTPKVNFSRLPSGHYIFEVYACNNDGLCSAEPLITSFMISKVFYLQCWFIMLTLFLLGGVGYYLYVQKIGNIRREEKLRSKYEKQLKEVEMKALRAQMNPHFIFNSLNSIQKFIFTKDEYAASQYLTKFSRLIRLILDHSDQEFISLSSEIDHLNLYVEMESLRFDKSFDYEISVGSDIDLGAKIPSMVIQPHVENAIWHGLLHKNERGKISISIYKKDTQTIEIVIEDDGVGRKMAAEFKSKQILSKKSYGSEISNERIRIFNDLHGVKSNFQVFDPMDGEGQSAGTRVVIQLAYLLKT